MRPFLGQFQTSSALKLFFYAFIFILLRIPFSVCQIKDIRIADDPRPMIFFGRFGFGFNGRVVVYVENVSYKSIRLFPSSPLDPSCMGFFLVRNQYFPRIIHDSRHVDRFCVLSSEYVETVFRFSDLTIGSNYNGTISLSNPDEYNLVFANCLSNYKVSMTVHTEMYNLHNGAKNFLPAGQTPLPRIYFFIFLIYCGFFVIWVFVCVHRSQVLDKIHWLMAVLLICKALKLLCASEDRTYIERTGTPHGWDVAFYVFAFFKGTLLLTVIALIGAGWSVLRPFLKDHEKKVLMAVIPLQVLENLAYAIVEEIGPSMRNPAWWNFVFLVVDLVCCFAVMLPVMWSIRALRESVSRDKKAVQSLEKLTLFRKFYMVAVGYLYFTRVVVLALDAILGYRLQWLVALIAEGASLGFYSFVFWKFQPVEKNPYSMLRGESQENVIEISRIYTLDDEDDDPDDEQANNVGL